MSGELKYTVSSIGAGWVGLLSSPSGLLRVTLPQSSAQEAERLLGDWVEEAVRADDCFADLTERLRSYFAGHMANFPDELDLSAATDFQREVWETARLIPYGETQSYNWVAEQIGKTRAVRAVGQALARNPLPIIIPCHRVVTKDGRLGGYSGEVEMKQYLLRLEASSRQ